MSKRRIFSIVSLIVVVLVMIYQFKHLPNSLRGTYIMGDLRGTLISFDNDKSGEFLYYYIDETEKQVEEKGTFERQMNGKYKIECKSIMTDSAVLVGKKLMLEVNGQELIFIKQSDLPTKIITQ